MAKRINMRNKWSKKGQHTNMLPNRLGRFPIESVQDWMESKVIG